MRTSQPSLRSPRAARLSPLAAGLALVFSPLGIAATYPVDNALPSGTGSLAQAILDANAECEANFGASPVIQFNGPFVVGVPSALPSFSCASGLYYPRIEAGGLVTPTGYDAYGGIVNTGGAISCGLAYDYNFSYGGNLTVHGLKVQGFTSGAGVCGVVAMRDNLVTGNGIGVNTDWPQPSAIGDSYGGNIIVNNDVKGINLAGGGSIRNNRIGTLSGATAQPNDVGIYIRWSGGFTVADNVISGNTAQGIFIEGDYGGSDISGNMIGVRADESAALGNGKAGIDITFSNATNISGNTIGGNGHSGIASRDRNGISIDDSSINVTGNRIGVTSDGSSVPNAGSGIELLSSNSTDISGNTIGANAGNGISISESPVYVTGNWIGVTSRGTPVPNGGTGVDAFCSGYIDLSDNQIANNGGDGVNAAGMEYGQLVDNVIRDNSGAGLRITSSSCYPYGGALYVEINTVTGNGGDGIVAGMDGVQITAGSVSGNAGKNINSLNRVPPEITSVVQNTDGSVTINFTQAGPVDYTFHVQFYANSTLGQPGGEVYLGDTFITISSSPQPGSYTVGGAALLAKGFSKATFMPDNISATSTQGGGTTSEFAQPMPTLTAPAATITPNPADFGTIEVDTSSPAKTIIVRSVGDQPLTFTSIGSDPFCYGGPVCYGGAFTCSTTCNTSTAYATGQACTVTAQFTPIFTGLQSTSIYFCHNGIGSPQVLTLQGDAIPPPPLVLSPTDWDFGSVGVGNVSASKFFSLTNRYDGSLPVSIATVGEFDILGQDCGTFVPASSTCHIEVAFAPTQSGGQTGQLNVTIPPLGDTKAAIVGGVAARARLAGDGVAGGSLVLPDAVDLGAAIVGGDAVTHQVEIRNNGSTAVTLDGIQVSEPFTLETTCAATLDAGQACLVTLSFAATQPGPVTGTLTVTSSGGSAAIPVTALGQTAAAPLIRISPASIGFGSRVIGSQSDTQPMTISNVGGVDATSFSLASVTIDFVIAGQTCGSVLAAGASCTANVAFRPLGFGTRFGSIVVTSSAPNTPLSMGLSGTGCRPFLPGSARFGSDSNCAP